MGKKWWHRETGCDPVSLEPIAELAYPPFALLTEGEGSMAILFDPATLSEYLVTTAVFVHPISRRALTRFDCVALDAHMRRAGLPDARVSASFDMVEAMKRQVGVTSTEGALFTAEERAAAQAAAVPDNIQAVREASVVLTNLFDFSSEGGGGGYSRGAPAEDYHASAFAEPIDLNDSAAFPAMVAPAHAAQPRRVAGRSAASRARIGGRYAPQTFDHDADFPTLGGGPAARGGGGVGAGGRGGGGSSRSAQWVANARRAAARYETERGGSRIASQQGRQRLAVHPSLVPRPRPQQQAQTRGGLAARPATMASAVRRPAAPMPQRAGPSAAWLTRGSASSGGSSSSRTPRSGGGGTRGKPPPVSSREAFPSLAPPPAPPASSAWASAAVGGGGGDAKQASRRKGKKAAKATGVKTFYLAPSKPKPKPKPKPQPRAGTIPSAKSKHAASWAKASTSGKAGKGGGGKKGRKAKQSGSAAAAKPKKTKAGTLDVGWPM